MKTVRITQSTRAPIRVDLASSQPIKLSIRPSGLSVARITAMPGPRGATGERGPDPWLDPIQSVEADGDLIIDYRLGKHVRVSLQGDVTAFEVIGWPAADRIARLTLEILNTGDFGFLAWPEGTIWQAGSVPEITRGAGARDRIILSTTDAGAIIYGDPVGFDYRAN